MVAMRDKDPLLHLLIDFFGLPPHTPPENIAQNLLPAWDSLAMVQLISELQGTFSIDFNLEEIEYLRSYDEIRAALTTKGVFPTETTGAGRGDTTMGNARL
jgi:acyl carrier protein